MTKKMNIPFSPPDITEAEIQEVADALRSGWITTGPRTKKLEKEISVTVNVHENGTLIGAMADFTPLSCSFHLQVNLLGEGSKAEWHLATLSCKDAKKIYETSVTHKAKHTEALMSNCGIARDSSKITFTGISFPESVQQIILFFQVLLKFPTDTIQ